MDWSRVRPRASHGPAQSARTKSGPEITRPGGLEQTRAQPWFDPDLIPQRPMETLIGPEIATPSLESGSVPNSKLENDEIGMINLQLIPSKTDEQYVKWYLAVLLKESVAWVPDNHRNIVRKTQSGATGANRPLCRAPASLSTEEGTKSDAEWPSAASVTGTFRGEFAG